MAPLGGFQRNVSEGSLDVFKRWEAFVVACEFLLADFSHKAPWKPLERGASARTFYTKARTVVLKSSHCHIFWVQNRPQDGLLVRLPCGALRASVAGLGSVGLGGSLLLSVVSFCWKIFCCLASPCSICPELMLMFCKILLKFF